MTVMTIVMPDVTQVEVRVRSLIHSARTAPTKDCRLGCVVFLGLGEFFFP